MENCTERYTAKNPRLLIRKNLHSQLYANAHSLIRTRGTPRYTLCCTPPYTLQCTRTYTHDARAHIRHNARTPIHVICTLAYTLIFARAYIRCTSAYTLNFARPLIRFSSWHPVFPGLDFWRRIWSGGLVTTPAARRRPASDFSGGVLILIPGQATLAANTTPGRRKIHRIIPKNAKIV